ncbi:MAG: hypothetical protein JSR28_03330 [Proteobacteria bacterium]|nr:hypothetical protein [Pseudomonadota bacterium]
MIALFAISLATPAVASDQTGPSTPATKSEQKPKTVCRTVEKTGSIMRQRVCKTQDEWASIDQANEATKDRRIEQRSAVGVGSGS